jgi:hypothetical protein
MAGKPGGRSGAAGLVLAGLLLPVIGCSIAGHWYMTEAVPNRQVFSIDDASFTKDGHFSATSTIEGVTREEEGTYKFTGFELMLRPKQGGQRTYVAQYQLGKLVLTDSDRNKVVLKKGQRGQ